MGSSLSPDISRGSDVASTPGKQGERFHAMVVSYWEMAASIVNRGLIDEEFFFENSGEMVRVGAFEARG
jgi:hypothetical protein